jgi:hypothetical protein
MVLATFGTLVWYGANHLHTYIQDQLMLLIKPGVKRVVDGKSEAGSVEAERYVVVHKQEDLQVVKGGGCILEGKGMVAEGREHKGYH